MPTLKETYSLTWGIRDSSHSIQKTHTPGRHTMRKQKSNAGPRKLTDFFPSVGASTFQDGASRSSASACSDSQRKGRGKSGCPCTAPRGLTQSSSHSTPFSSPQKSKMKQTYGQQGTGKHMGDKNTTNDDTR